MKKNNTLRWYVVFHGRVQGVGFRYTAYQAADRAGVTGWVRNEYDGTVSMEIQGTREQLERVLMEIEGGRYIRIDRVDVRETKVDENERRFRVRY